MDDQSSRKIKILIVGYPQAIENPRQSLLLQSIH